MTLRHRASRRAAGALLLAATLTLAACGGGDDAGAGPAAPEGAAGTTEPAGAGTTAAGGGGDAVPTPAGDDRCQVEVTGDKTASWTAPGGIMALNTHYWLTPEQRKAFAGDGDAFYFIVNCDGSGSGGSLSFYATPSASEQTIPFGPATYALQPSGAITGGSGQDGPIGVLVTLDDSETNWGVSEPGVLEITRFDDERLAGTFSFTAKDVLANSGSSEGGITVSGSFDFGNPN